MDLAAPGAKKKHSLRAAHRPLRTGQHTRCTNLALKLTSLHPEISQNFLALRAILPGNDRTGAQILFSPRSARRFSSASAGYLKGPEWCGVRRWLKKMNAWLLGAKKAVLLGNPVFLMRGHDCMGSSPTCSYVIYPLRCALP